MTSRTTTLLALAITAVMAVAALVAARAVVGMRAPAEPGFLDDAAITPAQTARLAAIRALGRPDAVSAIREIQAGERGLDRTDVELLRQDRRRAQAYYPDVRRQDLIEGSWMPFTPGTDVPAKLGGPNRSSVETDHGDVLDGPAYLGVVAPAYTGRADAAATKAYMARPEAARKGAAAAAPR